MVASGDLMISERILKASPLFENFTETGVRILASICVERRFVMGATVFTEGAVSNSMLIVADGRISLTSRSDRGLVSLGEVGPGDWLGELSLIEPGHRMCTATAKTVVNALEMGRSDFQDLTAQKPQACTKLMMALVSRFARRVAQNRDSFRWLIQRPS